jgi:long-subunit fatty acid transport protein
MDQLYVIGLNVEYQFNPHLSAMVGYNYDLLNSDVDFRDFDRNRVYLGVTARY